MYTRTGLTAVLKHWICHADNILVCMYDRWQNGIKHAKNAYSVCKLGCILYRTDSSYSYDASWEHEIPQWVLGGQSIPVKEKLGAREVVNAYAKQVFCKKWIRKWKGDDQVHNTCYVHRHQMWGSGGYGEISGEGSNARVASGYSSTVDHVRPYQEPCRVPSPSAGVSVVKSLLHFQAEW